MNEWWIFIHLTRWIQIFIFTQTSGNIQLNVMNEWQLQLWNVNEYSWIFIIHSPFIRWQDIFWASRNAVFKQILPVLLSPSCHCTQWKESETRLERRNESCLVMLWCPSQQYWEQEYDLSACIHLFCTQGAFNGLRSWCCSLSPAVHILVDLYASTVSRNPPGTSSERWEGYTLSSPDYSWPAACRAVGGLRWRGGDFARSEDKCSLSISCACLYSSTIPLLTLGHWVALRKRMIWRWRLLNRQQM